METVGLKASKTSLTNKSCKIVVKKGKKVFYKTPSFPFVHHAKVDDETQHESRYFVPKSMSFWLPVSAHLRQAQESSNVDFYEENSPFICYLNTTVRQDGKRYEIEVPMDALRDISIENDIPHLTDQDIDKMIGKA